MIYYFRRRKKRKVKKSKGNRKFYNYKYDVKTM